MKPLFIAFYWHQHQPCYQDLLTGEITMPWVRLHGIKDYIGMVRLLRDFPEMRQTFNYVPTLLTQLDDIASGRRVDQFQQLAQRPADDLDETEAARLLDQFFMANWDHLVRPHPRYGQLLEQRAFGKRSAADAAKDFSVQDRRDLQVWFNLAWFHPLIVEDRPALSELMEKGRDFSEADKEALRAEQQAVLAEIIPLHRRLQDAGQIEVTTSPFYHPILPLLCRMESAREALPDLTLPRPWTDCPDDAAEQLRRGIACYETHFQRRPRGLWPSEGSVSPKIIPLVVEAGIDWIATDEEILWRSLDGGGDPQGGRPSLYRPYRVESDGAAVNIIFRDQALSDLIGFKYHRMPPDQAARDFVGRLHQIAEHAPEGALVNIILDGENAWEYYPRSATEFLRRLYEMILAEPGLEPTTVSDYLAEGPPSETLPRLFPGSWIYHNFATWVGHDEKNRGWEYLHRVRTFLAETDGPPERIAGAWDSLYAAEGSDWFWWYGDDHFSGNDAEFDRLFRKHLQNVYGFLETPAPDFLDIPILQEGREAAFIPPRAFIDVVLDGRLTHFFEWLGAGCWEAHRDAGAMQQVSPRLIGKIFFGFNLERFFLRIDAWDERRSMGEADAQFRVCFLHDRELCLDIRPEPEATALSVSAEGPGVAAPAVAVDRIVEVACPFETLGLKPEDKVQFFVVAARGDGTLQRVPEHDVIEFTVPTETFEQEMWQV